MPFHLSALIIHSIVSHSISISWSDLGLKTILPWGGIQSFFVGSLNIIARKAAILSYIVCRWSFHLIWFKLASVDPSTTRSLLSIAHSLIVRRSWSIDIFVKGDKMYPYLEYIIHNCLYIESQPIFLIKYLLSSSQVEYHRRASHLYRGDRLWRFLLMWEVYRRWSVCRIV